MKNSTNKSFTHKLFCDIFGHKYQTSKNVTSHVKEYTCTCCKHQLTTNSNGELIELTPKYQEINALLADIYVRRRSRLNSVIMAPSSTLG